MNCETLGRDANLECNDAIAVLTYNNSNVNRAMIEDEYINGKKVCSESNICTVTNCPFEKYPASLGYNCTNVDQFQLLVPTPENELPDSESVDASTWFFNFGFDSVEFTSIQSVVVTLFLPYLYRPRKTVEMR